MSTIDTSTWNPDADLNVEIEGIPLNSNASIAQTWQALRVLMAAVKGDGDAIKSMIDIMQGASASADGASGLVPKPLAGDQDKVLKGDGTWGTVTAPSVAWSDVTGKPSTFTPSSHSHGNLANDGKVGTASGKPLVTGTGGAVEAGSFGSTAGTFCEGNDSRLSNARTPTSHTHVGTEVALTGYSKPSTTSAIAATDTMNAAVGKLEKEGEYLDAEILLVDAVAANGVAIASANQLFISDMQNGKADDSAVVHKSGDTMTGALNVRASNVNLAVEPSSTKEDFRFYITRNSADTVHNGNLMRLGVVQSANAKDYRIMLGVSNPRAGNLPTPESVVEGTDDADASPSNCWGSIGVYYDYSKNRAYPYCYGLDTCEPTDNSTQRLATNYWVRTATGDFACNAATASAFNSSKAVTLTGAVTGTASSTGGWSVSTTWRSCIVGRTDSGTSNPWYKVASRTLNSASNNYNISFFVENCNTSNKFSGLLHVSLSTNSNKEIINANTKFEWLVNNGFALEDFVLVCPAAASPTVEIWTKLAAGYLRRRFVVISEGLTGSTSILYNLYNAASAGQEASIPTAGTQVASSPSLLEQRVKALEEALNG